ncbi:cyclic nucleotide-binding domain-containing protein [Mucilaginibacter aquaedulcis]|nr:cyclic nucleotide-binding domain-containing protein [Mucilaginibacter aquaedulcis]MDN3551257.1 cyclic nucleotide-binding domain-containing protein [Mucilaginibacter aquaedulcis]
MKRKAFLLTDGEICKHSIFITEGCLRGYTVDKRGNEHVLSFAPPGWWIADLYSLFSQRPGSLYIAAITDTTTLMLSNTNKETYIITCQNLNAFSKF